MCGGDIVGRACWRCYCGSLEGLPALCVRLTVGTTIFSACILPARQHGRSGGRALRTAAAAQWRWGRCAARDSESNSARYAQLPLRAAHWQPRLAVPLPVAACVLPGCWRAPIPLQVLLGWVGAQRDGALLKYADFLAEQGYTSVRSVQPTGEQGNSVGRACAVAGDSPLFVSSRAVVTGRGNILSLPGCCSRLTPLLPAAAPAPPPARPARRHCLLAV